MAGVQVVSRRDGASNSPVGDQGYYQQLILKTASRLHNAPKEINQPVSPAGLGKFRRNAARDIHGQSFAPSGFDFSHGSNNNDSSCIIRWRIDDPARHPATLLPEAAWFEFFCKARQHSLIIMEYLTLLIRKFTCNPILSVGEKTGEAVRQFGSADLYINRSRPKISIFFSYFSFYF